MNIEETDRISGHNSDLGHRNFWLFLSIKNQFFFIHEMDSCKTAFVSSCVIGHEEFNLEMNTI